MDFKFTLLDFLWRSSRVLYLVGLQK